MRKVIYQESASCTGERGTTYNFQNAARAQPCKEGEEETDSSSACRNGVQNQSPGDPLDQHLGRVTPEVKTEQSSVEGVSDGGVGAIGNVSVDSDDTGSTSSIACAQDTDIGGGCVVGVLDLQEVDRFDDGHGQSDQEEEDEPGD